jgi:hypothetical protein
MAGHGADYGLDKGWKVLSTYNSSAAAGVLPYRVVKIAAGDTIDLQTASNTRSLGVVQEALDVAKVATGKAVVDVRLQGVSKCVAGAAIAQGAEVMATTAGKVITAATSANIVFGRALSAAAADGDYVDIEIIPGAGGRLIP